jgi:5-methylcytosine-specific restriction endonuclease McrA
MGEPMKVCNTCNEEKGSPEFSKRASSQDGLARRCKSCDKIYKRQHYLKNKEMIAVKAAEYRVGNSGAIATRMKKYYQENKGEIDAKNKQNRLDSLDSYRETSSKYYQTNKADINAKNRAWHHTNKEQANLLSAKWKRDNKGTVNAYCAKRRAAKLNRTPCWLTEYDVFVITEMYTQAQDLTSATGIAYHVDHTIPLQGDTVSGLHTPTNLQIITAVENLSKNNSYTVGG